MVVIVSPLLKKTEIMDGGRVVIDIDKLRKKRKQKSYSAFLDGRCIEVMVENRDIERAPPKMIIKFG